ncbi:uncharacterized protein L203_103895 [Cryptococcus depauperatus CBS 7841]|uniref:Rhodanese domain-containing protein n=1 Tax=Cryptococcus depauperatus CBS 7841 TaxID=1295531 RepID=A0A1E3HJ94_9TREE|nr:adenylyltransferase and sulfurtransferase [Cryptococcus depauperatus CBS 7841]
MSSLHRRIQPETLPLELQEYERYGRQMIMPGFGLKGQISFKSARIAVVGAGGLGCPVLQYLAGAGVGTIGIFDHDTVGMSNLHRQILHATKNVGMNKAESACLALKALNDCVNVVPYPVPITSSNALSLLRPFQMIVDCTDRPLSRYLLSDVSVRLDVPLISGAAISSAGQWAVYGGKTKQGKRRACYRCIWPKVLGDSGGTCEEQGVWGVVTGIVGVGMAEEAIKLIMGKEDSEAFLHIHHLGSSPFIRSVRLKKPSDKCIACGPKASITDDLDAFNYDMFCAGDFDNNRNIDELAHDKEQRLAAQDLDDILRTTGDQVTLIDTRPAVEYEICSLPGSTNISLETILSKPEVVPITKEIVFICRRGNDSQVAAAALRASLSKTDGIRIRDVRGGLVSWREVDPNFPIY